MHLVRSGMWGRRRAVKRIVLPLVLLAVGCGEDGGTPEPGSPSPVEIVEAPELSLGEPEGPDEQEFYNVRDPFLLDDGKLVVPVAGHDEIRVFDEGGEFLRRHGRDGEGPGEFRTLLQAWPRGDSIAAFDPILSRITRFPPDGEPEVVSFRESESPPSTLAGVLPDGWLGYHVRVPGPQARDRLVVDRFNREGERVQEAVVIVPGMQRVPYAEGGRGPDALSPKARFQFRFHEGQGELYVAETLTPAVHVLAPETGDTLRTVAWDPVDAPSPEEAYSRMMDEARQRGIEDAWGVRGGGAPPDTVPVFSDFLVDEEGLVWVRPHVPERDARSLGGNVGMGPAGPGGTWTVHAPDGDLLGSVEVPDGLTPYQVTSDRMVGVHRDELGVERVRVHRLERR